MICDGVCESCAWYDYSIDYCQYHATYCSDHSDDEEEESDQDG